MVHKINQLLYYLFQFPFYRLTMGKIGSSSRLVKAKIDGHKNIYIGSKVFVNDHGWLACLPLTGNKNCRLTIGDGTYIGRFCHFYATSKIEIGTKVLIADRVYIADNLHEFSDVKIPVIDQGVRQTNEVTIGDGAWLGENVSVVGASVGKQSVIGANSVVTKDIPDYCVAVGSPARIIKRFSFDKQEWLQTDTEGNFLKSL
jgi:acetyltransferase-like isoleucine patch superfamily enzyme